MKANQKGADHGCIAYIPILDIVETRCVILSNNICDVQRHGMQADLYYNCLLKQVKQNFLCRSLYIHCIPVIT